MNKEDLKDYKNNQKWIEDAKQELKGYIYNKRWLEEKLEDIKERKNLINNITATLSDMPKRK